jgi:hypothetical protein
MMDVGGGVDSGSRRLKPRVETTTGGSRKESSPKVSWCKKLTQSSGRSKRSSADDDHPTICCRTLTVVLASSVAA